MVKKKRSELEFIIDRIEKELEGSPKITSGQPLGQAYGLIADLEKMGYDASNYKMRLINLYRKYMGYNKLKK